MIAHENQARHVLQQNPDTFSRVVARDPALATKHYYILISKGFYAKHPKIAEQIWDALAELRESHLPELLREYARSE